MPMDWQDMRESSNVEDRRSQGYGGGGRVAGGGRPFNLGLGGIVIAIVGSLLFGLNPLQILGLLGNFSGTSGNYAPAPQSNTYYPKNDQSSQFVKRVLGDLEDTWGTIFQQGGGQYQPAKLVLFAGAVNSGCGFAESASGPFYCPTDQRVYLDTSFFGELQNLRGTGSEFARAYVIAHEIAHHVQNQMGISDQVRQLQSRSSRAQANDLSVRLELQADCFAGVWGHYAKQRNLVDMSDVAGAVRTAQEIGDDYIQRRSRGYITPESFTHGSSQQRARWFQTGFQTGDWKSCDTFNQSI